MHQPEDNVFWYDYIWIFGGVLIIGALRTPFLWECIRWSIKVWIAKKIWRAK